jgi:hypothetical protein
VETNRRKLGITAVGVAMTGALCFGVATPAFACDTGNNPPTVSSTSTATSAHFAKQLNPPTFDQKKAWALAFADYWQQSLDKFAQLVAASDYFTDAQKAQFAAKTAAAEQALTALKTAISAATTPQQLKAALVAGWKDVKWPLLKHPGKHYAWGHYKSFAKTPAAVSYAKAHPASYAKAYRPIYVKQHHAKSHNKIS